MKVCMISPSFPDMKCGVGDYTARLVEHIAPLADKITVITVDDPKIKFAKISKAIKNVEVCSLIKKWNFFSLMPLFNKMKSLNPDIIHIQYHWRGYNNGFVLKGIMITMLPLFLKAAKIKCLVVVTLHSFLGAIGGPYLFRGAGSLRRLALKPLLFFSDRIIINNKFDSQNLCDWSPSIKKKIVYIGGGSGHHCSNELFLGDIPRIKSEHGIPQGEIILSNFGYMFPHKGLEEILEAMNILRSKGYPVRLLAIGGFDIDHSFNKEYFEKLQKMAERLNLKPYIQWTGFCDPQKASLFLLASDICVMPFVEGVSESRSSFMGALSHGLPIITTFTDRTPEELIDHVNVILIPPRDHIRLVEAIEELIKSKDLRTKISRAAKKLYDEEYSWDVIVRKTLQVYRNGTYKKMGN